MGLTFPLTKIIILQSIIIKPLQVCLSVKVNRRKKTAIYVPKIAEISQGFALNEGVIASFSARFGIAVRGRGFKRQRERESASEIPQAYIPR